MMQKQVENFLRIYGHEAGQIIVSLNRIKKLYLKNSSVIKSMPDDKINVVLGDIDGLLKQFDLLINKVDMTFCIPEPKKISS